MKINYPILIEKGDDTHAWGITFPDIPGCFSASDEEADILDNAREAVLLHLESLTEIPKASSLRQHKAPKGYYLALVDVDLTLLQGPSKRINITVPLGALNQIDAAAKRQNKTRSAFLTESALRAV